MITEGAFSLGTNDCGGPRRAQWELRAAAVVSLAGVFPRHKGQLAISSHDGRASKMPQNWTWVASYVLAYTGCCACGIGNSMAGTLCPTGLDPRSIAGACKSSNSRTGPLLRPRQADGRQGRRFQGPPSATTSLIQLAPHVAPPRAYTNRHGPDVHCVEADHDGNEWCIRAKHRSGFPEPVSGCAYLDPWSGSSAAAAVLIGPVKSPAARKWEAVPRSSS
jgi:hypothetical protein